MPKKAVVGKSLLRAKEATVGYKPRGQSEFAHLFVSDSIDTLDNRGKGKLQSVMERNDLDDFLCNAMLEDRNFEAERGSKIMIMNTAEAVKAEENPDREEIFDYHALPIPHRPAWDETTTPAELDRDERDAFLAWRRELARTEEVSQLTITPYEKNLEVWKQLWRVIERSDLIVEILDARNPLLFRCKDLESYVQKIDPNKRILLLINKSDFLSQHMRNTWARYFRSQNMRFVFFSAIAEQAEIDEGIDDSEYSDMSEEEDAAGLEAAHQHEMRRLAVLKLEARGKVKPSSKKPEADEDAAPVPQAKKGGMFSVLSVDEDSVEEPSDESESETEAPAVTAKSVQSESESESENSDSDEDQSEEKPVKTGKASQSQAVEEKATVLPDGDETLLKNRAQLLDYFFRTRTELELEGPITVGMVGYPNVGKSSTINVLLQDHRVAVSATPGKTRHFQSIHFSEDLVVCDCPGLVFPTFMASRADLVCSGVLPIDQLKVENYVAPVSVVCQRVSRAQFGSQYGLKFPAHARIDAHMLMMTYAKKRGLVAGHGFANEPVSARLILKDYTNGKLLYCHSPPGLTDAERAEFYNSLEQTKYQPEPANQRELADQHAVDEYVGGIGPQAISRRKMRGNTKAKQRLRRDRKLGRTLVPNKGAMVELDAIEAHSGGGFNGKRAVSNFRRKEYLPEMDNDGQGLKLDAFDDDEF